MARDTRRGTFALDTGETARLPVPPPPSPAGWRLHVLTQHNLAVNVTAYAAGVRAPLRVASGVSTLTDQPLPPSCELVEIDLAASTGDVEAWLTPAPYYPLPL